MVEVPKIITQERVSERHIEQIIDVPIPQLVEELVELMKIVPHHPLMAERTMQSFPDPRLASL